MELRLTRLQADEILHKLSILESEPDLQDSYGLTQAQATTMYERYWSALASTKTTLTIDVLPHEADVLIGELENAVEIQADNTNYDGDPSTLAYRTSLRRIIRALKGGT